VGADAYLAGKARHIAGVVVRDDRLIIRLRRPVPDLPVRLTMPFFCAVPVGTPHDPKGLRVMPSAGPYQVVSYTPGQGVVLERNPNYRGSRPHRLTRIEVTIGVSRQKTDEEIEAGDVDYALDGPAPADIRRLAARYGPGSPAAKKARQQYFISPTKGLDFFSLNTDRPLFHDVRLRRAVNYAIDRTALARIGSPFSQIPDQPTDHYLAPGIPGSRDVRIYPPRPDLAAARSLAGTGRRTAVLYICNVGSCDRLAQVVKANLAAIGIDVQIKALGFGTLYARIARPGEPFDLAYNSWLPDYPDPYAALNILLARGTGFAAPFDDPVYQRKLAAAAMLSGPRRYLAYGRLDEDLARNSAPWIAYGNISIHDFFSARMGCQVFQPAQGFMDLAALCIRK
jgi:ABC-type oligopeptide transport system substrate-binding subunit